MSIVLEEIPIAVALADDTAGDDYEEEGLEEDEEKEGGLPDDEELDEESLDDGTEAES